MSVRSKKANTSTVSLVSFSIFVVFIVSPRFYISEFDPAPHFLQCRGCATNVRRAELPSLPGFQHPFEIQQRRGNFEGTVGARGGKGIAMPSNFGRKGFPELDLGELLVDRPASIRL
jgi:hypothetical protein